MTKKRFNKLLRAWLVRGESRKFSSKNNWKLSMRHLADFNIVNRTVAGTTPYAEIWAQITDNGAITFGVGEKEK